MTGLFTPWGTMPFKAAEMPTIEELQEITGKHSPAGDSLGRPPAGRGRNESPATHPVANVGEEQNGAIAACSADSASRGAEVLIASSPRMPGFTGEDDGRYVEAAGGAAPVITISRDSGSEKVGGVAGACSAFVTRREPDEDICASGVTGGESAAFNSDSRGTSSRASDEEAGGGTLPPPASLPIGGASPVFAAAPAGAEALGVSVPAFSSGGEPPLRRALRARHLRPPSGVEDGALPHATRLLLRLVAVHERISQGEALARAVAFYADRHVGLRLLADAAEDIRAARAARHGNLSGKS